VIEFCPVGKGKKESKQITKTGDLNSEKKNTSPALGSQVRGEKTARWPRRTLNSGKKKRDHTRAAVPLEKKGDVPSPFFSTWREKGTKNFSVTASPEKKAPNTVP